MGRQKLYAHRPERYYDTLSEAAKAKKEQNYYDRRIKEYDEAIGNIVDKINSLSKESAKDKELLKKLGMEGEMLKSEKLEVIRQKEKAQLAAKPVTENKTVMSLKKIDKLIDDTIKEISDLNVKIVMDSVRENDSEQISECLDRADKLNSKLNELKTERQDIVSRIAELKAEISREEENKAANSRESESLKQQINAFKNVVRTAETRNKGENPNDEKKENDLLLRVKSRIATKTARVETLTEENNTMTKSIEVNKKKLDELTNGRD